MSETLAAWRSEIGAELEQAREQLREAREEFVVATDTARDERRLLNAMMLVLAEHDPRTPLASSLQRRVADRQDEVRRAVGTLARAENAVAALIARIADLEAATEQLDALQPQQVVEPAA